MRIVRVGSDGSVARYGAAREGSAGADRPGWLEFSRWLQGGGAAIPMRDHLLGCAGAGAIFWECREIHAGPPEWVVLPARGLGEVPGDPSAFAGKLAELRDPGGGGAITFGNLGGDATLVVPEPVAGAGRRDYGDLARFLRHAGLEQQRALWAAVGRAAEAALSRPGGCWISTAGLGVPWLHVRLDARPKYYRYAGWR